MVEREDGEKDRVMQEETGLIAAFNHIFGGAMTSFMGALVGRLMWHSGEVKAKRRRILGPELIWELPTALGMGFVGEGISQYLDWHDSMRTGLIVCLSYLGPRGVQALVEKFITKKVDK